MALVVDDFPAAACAGAERRGSEDVEGDRGGDGEREGEHPPDPHERREHVPAVGARERQRRGPGDLLSGVMYLMLTYCVEKRGPVFTAAFSPLSQMFVAGIDLFVLHEPLYLGRSAARMDMDTTWSSALLLGYSWGHQAVRRNAAEGRRGLHRSTLTCSPPPAGWMLGTGQLASRMLLLTSS